MGITTGQLLAMLSSEEASVATIVGDFALVMRAPLPDEVQVPLGSTVALRVVALEGDPVVAGEGVSELEIRVDGTLVFDLTGGLFVDVDWQGAGNAQAPHTATDPYTFHEVTLDPTSPPQWTTEQVVTVEVSGEDHLSNTFSESYSFTALDVTPPQVVSAEAIDRQQVRVTFSEAMATTPQNGAAEVTSTNAGPFNLSGGETLIVAIGGEQQTLTFDAPMFLAPGAATDAEVAFAISALLDGAAGSEAAGGGVTIATDDRGDSVSLQVLGGTANAVLGFPVAAAYGSSAYVLAAENFTFTRHNVFPEVAVSLTAESVQLVDGSGDTQVDVSTQWAMTPGAPYRVTVDDDVEDAHSVPIDPDYLSAEFDGWSPPWPARRDASLEVPADLYEKDATGHATAIINCFQEVEDLILYDIDTLIDPIDPDLASDAEIDLHLTELGNPFDWADLDLTAAQRRKLAELLPTLYQYRGTAQGIEAAIRLLLEIEVEVVPHWAEVWVLGEDLLGDYYPAQVLSANPQTYNLSAASLDLWIAVDGGHTIQGVDTGAPSFTVPGPVASLFTAGTIFRVVDSTGNDATYEVDAAGSTDTGDETIIPLTTTPPSALADGRIVDRIEFSNVAGIDFATPTAATADEVATAIAARTEAGAAALDPGGGTVVAVISTNPTGTIQVVGGTANAVLGFDTSLHSSTGGCVLGPTDSRGIRTFDIVTNETLSSLEESLIERIAVRFKMVNEHFGRIRTGYVVSDDGIWRLGSSRLGDDTVLG